MKTLIGMREFVLLEFSKRNPYYYQDTKVLNRINNYANFLSRPPQLSDFVPCGEDGLPIKPYIKTEAEIFADDNSHCRVISKEEIAYQQALDKVLFKGFEVCNDNEEFTRLKLNNGTLFFITFYKESEMIVSNPSGGNQQYITTLESLTPYNLELTENAKNIV